MQSIIFSLILIIYYPIKISIELNYILIKDKNFYTLW